jgi:hypothetical protein
MLYAYCTIYHCTGKEYIAKEKKWGIVLNEKIESSIRPRHVLVGGQNLPRQRLIMSQFIGQLFGSLLQCHTFLAACPTCYTLFFRAKACHKYGFDFARHTFYGSHSLVNVRRDMFF